MKVLAAPLTYILQDMYGSESYWLYKIMDSLSVFNVNFISLTMYVELYHKLNNVRIIELDKNGNEAPFNKLKFMYKCLKVASKILREEHIDIIHHFLIGYEQGFNLLPILGYTRNVPFIIGPAQPPQTYVSNDESGLSPGARASYLKSSKLSHFLSNTSLSLSTPILHKLFQKTLTECDTLITVNEHAKDLYSKYINPKKIKVIPPGVDIDKFKYFPQSTNNTSLEILTVGYLVKRKGIEYLIRAMPMILSEFPDVKLRIIGDGPQRLYLEKLTEKLEIKNNVIFQGLVPHPQIEKFYEKSDIFCLPSLSEGSPTVLREAMACGKPCVATNIIGSNEIVEQGKTGFLVPIKDTSVLAESLLKLLQDEELRYKMGLEARKIAEEKYDWNVIARQYYEIYKELVG